MTSPKEKAAGQGGSRDGFFETLDALPSTAKRSGRQQPAPHPRDIAPSDIQEIYDGRTLLGSVRLEAPEYRAIGADGKTIGYFSTRSSAAGAVLAHAKEGGAS